MDARCVVCQLRSSRRSEAFAAAKRVVSLLNGGQAQLEALEAAGAVPALLTRLQDSSAVLCVQSAKALTKLCMHNDSARAAAVASGGITAAVCMLSSSDVAIQLGGAWLLEILLHGDISACSAEALSAGAVPGLLRLLVAEDDELVELAACQALANLSINDDAQAAILAGGGLAAIARLLRARTRDAASDRQLLISAADALHNLCVGDVAIKVAAAEAGVPQALTALLLRAGGSGDAGVQEAAVNALDALGDASETTAAAIAAAGGIEAVAALVRQPSVPAETLSLALTLLSRLACESHSRTAAIVATGVLPRLVQLMRDLSSGDDAAEVAACAAAAVGNLTGTGGTPRVAAEAVALGMAPLLPPLMGSSLEGAESAATIALNLTCHGQAAAVSTIEMLAALADAAIDPNEHLRAKVQATMRAIVTSHFAGGAGAAAQDQPGGAGAAAACRPPLQQLQQQQLAAGSQTQTAHSNCAAPGCRATADLRRCSGCKVVSYCGEACSRTHWKAHRAECRRRQAERAAAGGGTGGR